MTGRRIYERLVKPMGDRFAALAGLFITSPLILLAACLLAIANRGRIFFIQERPGLLGQPFRVIKFRTMNDRRDASGQLLPDDQRLTAVGRLIRKTSIDELPQLLNVLAGQMSIVGPRPWLMEYLLLYTSEQARRHAVKPGITGWSQVNGRNTLDWESRFTFDLYYVDHLSFTLDLKILMMTVWKVFKSEGISGVGSATMERFTGKK